MYGKKNLRQTDSSALRYAYIKLSFTLSNHLVDFLKDIWNFMRVRKKFWLVPVIVVLLLLGILVVIGGGSALAPFIYTLF